MSKKEIMGQPRGGGEGILPEKSGGMCDPLPETLTLFPTKISDFPCPFLDPTKNFDTVSQTYFLIEKLNVLSKSRYNVDLI